MSDGDSLVFDSAVLINGDALADEIVRIGVSAPVKAKPLRKFEDGALRSGLLSLPQGWTSVARLRLSATLQFMVRRGRIMVGSRTLGANAFVVVPAGGVMPVMTAQADSELLLIIDEGQAYKQVPGGGNDVFGDAITTEDVYAIEPIVPVIAGRSLTGFERRVLWLDPASGADTRLLRIPAGFNGPGPNWHPVNEEIFCLAGEISPAQDRLMKAGWFLWNPAQSVHGYREVTIPGCTLLEWHDGPWDLIKYSEPVR